MHTVVSIFLLSSITVSSGVAPAARTRPVAPLEHVLATQGQAQQKIDEYNKNRTRIEDLDKKLNGDDPMSPPEVRAAEFELETLTKRQRQLRDELAALGVQDIPTTPTNALTTGGAGTVTPAPEPFAVPSFNTRMLRDAAADVEKAQKALQDAAREEDAIKRQAAMNDATVNLVVAEMKLAHLAAGPIGGGVTPEEARATEPISKNNAEIAEITKEVEKLDAEIEKVEGLLSQAQASAGEAAKTGAAPGLHGQLVNRYEQDLKPLVERRATLEQRRIALHQQNDAILVDLAKGRLASGVGVINQRLETENKTGRFTLHQAATGNEQRQAESQFLNWLYTAPGQSFGRPGPAGARARSMFDGVETVPLDSDERQRLGAQAPMFPGTVPLTGFASGNSAAAGNPIGAIASPINILSNPNAFNVAAVRAGGIAITTTQLMIAEPDESILDEIDGVLVIAGNERQRAMPPSIARPVWALLGWLTPARTARSSSVNNHRNPPVSREIWLPPFERGQGAAAAGLARITFKSLGASTGEAFEMTVVNDGPRPIRIDPAALVLEPLKNEVQKRIEQELSKAAGKMTTVKMNGYCLEFLKTPPASGVLYRIAGQSAQQEFAPARKILNATRALQKSGVLRPDSNPLSYFHSIRQWAIWTKEQKFDMTSFGRAFVEHTKKNVVAAGRQWTREAEKAIMGAVPGRWSAIAQILQEAERLPR